MTIDEEKQKTRVTLQKIDEVVKAIEKIEEGIDESFSDLKSYVEETLGEIRKRQEKVELLLQDAEGKPAIQTIFENQQLIYNTITGKKEEATKEP